MAETVMEYRIEALENSVSEIRQAVKSIDGSLQILARLEERHAETRDGLARAFKELEGHDTRVKDVETAMPALKEARKWVIAGVLGGLSLMGVSAFHIIFGSAQAGTHITKDK